MFEDRLEMGHASALGGAVRILFIICCLWSTTALGAEPDGGPGQRHLLRDKGEVGLLLTAPAWIRYTGRYDQSGKYRSVVERYSVSVYSFDGSVGIIDGLQLGFGLPMVQTVVGAAGDPDKSRFGLGDMTTHIGGEIRLDSIDVGGRLTTKTSTGDTAQDLINPAWPLGTGQTDLDLTVHLFRYAGDLTVQAKVGYSKRFAGELQTPTEKIDYEPGNVLHLEAGLVNWVNGQYGAGLAGLFHVVEADRQDLGGGLKPVGQGSAVVSIAASFTVRAAEWLHLVIDTRTSGLGTGAGIVETGAPVWGRNIRSTTFPPIMLSALVEI
jgi:hypothetical protein